jgi:hypothetical protein
VGSAVVATIVGFSWGGWVTGAIPGKSERLPFGQVPLTRRPAELAAT